MDEVTDGTVLAKYTPDYASARQAAAVLSQMAARIGELERQVEELFNRMDPDYDPGDE